MEMPFARLNIFRPSLLDGDRPELRIGELALLKLLNISAPFLPRPLQGLRPTKVKSLVETMIREAKNEEPGKRIFESPDFKNIAFQNPS
jgi:hypothetical protein